MLDAMHEKPLSKNMLAALLAVHESADVRTLDKGTAKALIARGLLDVDTRITALGTITAIERLPLKDQCRSISIDLHTMPWASAPPPEVFAYGTFIEQGFIGSYCEGGGFGAAIKALCLDALTEASIFFGTCIDAREDACLKGIVVLSHLDKYRLDVVLKQITQTSKAKYLSAFEELLSYRLIHEWYPGLSLEFADAMFDAIPKSHFERLARWISKDHAHRNGWPDLTLVKGGRLEFVEVKTTDRLHQSQLITIPALIREIGANVSVLQLISAKNPFKAMPLCSEV